MAEQAEKERVFDIAATAANLKRATAAANKIVRDEYPPLDANDLQQLVRPPTLDPIHWTPAHLAASQAAWQADPMRPAILDLHGNNSIAPLWRYTMRFFRKFPDEIIGDNDLVYDDSSNSTVSVNGQDVRRPNWSAPFAKALLTLLCHDMWQDNPDAAAIALQYVIKCHNNDQRTMQWPKLGTTIDSSFLGQFRVTMALSPGNVELPEIHRQVDQRIGNRSVWSKLFSEIEALAFRAAPARAPLRSAPLTGNDVGTYTVATSHLNILINALDAIKDRHGMNLFRRAEFFHRTADAAMKSNDLPSKANFPAYREQALVAMRHRKAKAANVAAVPAAAPAAPAATTAPSTGAPAASASTSATAATTAPPAPPKDRPTITGGEPEPDDTEVPQTITLSAPNYALPARGTHEVSAEFASLDLE
ncbi:hypothetical protein PG985_007891 [Apiospora marii]|uniref:Uncharacterized protein n=1 Tax=Apiospora marii TaxID=335849 RepID=A0ABR1R8Y6_9PEZI